jgi:quinol monooxygenase YgiN
MRQAAVRPLQPSAVEEKNAVIHVVATIELAPGTREAFLAEFRRIVPLVKAEAGCLDYGPTVDVPTGLPAQGSVRDDVVTVVERWESVQALHAHAAAPHMQDYRAQVKDFVVRVQLQVLRPA